MSGTPTPAGVSRRGVLGLLALAGAGGLAACSPAESSRRPSPGTVLDVRDFGARGNGRTDDTDAVERALRHLRPGQTLRFPAGTYPHSRVLSVATERVTLTGPGRLLATAEQTSALRVDAPGVTLTHLTVAMGTTTQRWSSDDQHKIFLSPHAGIVVDDVSIEGSAAAGLFCYGAQRFRFVDVRVSDTRADGIHMTNGSRYGTVLSPRVERSGDDAVAVVSYLEDAQPCRAIEVHSPTVRTTTGGRGVSVVGGVDISYHDIDVDRSSAASVYVACESGQFTTRDVDGVLVDGGTITHANTDATINHGAVLVYSGRAGGTVADVLIEGLDVSDTRATASRQIGVVSDSPADTVSGVVLRDLRLAATPTPYQGDAPTSDFRLVDVRAAGQAVTAAAS